ncbi:MAG: extracellular solute-binding protein [Candidatus Accumulibacter sp.]|jgi:sn-glycerol 3-phosphate transport system substrate-binding protein|nr:extracellular solute-binding protein [Accumulibacter sp.]
MLLSRWLIAVLLAIAVSTGYAASEKIASPNPVTKKPLDPLWIDIGHRLNEEQAERLQPAIDAFNTKYPEIQARLLRRVEGASLKHLNLLTRDEHARFVARKARFKAIGGILREAKRPFDAKELSPELQNDFIIAGEELQALPLAFSTPVLYINKAIFLKAGLDPESPPQSWGKVHEAARKLYAKGQDCPFTTSWPAWVMLDNMSTWNGAPLIDSNDRLEFGGMVQIKHLAMLAAWRKAGYFRTFGGDDEADLRFERGECAMLTSTASIYPVLRGKSIDVGVSAFPWHDDVYGAPKNTLADGVSLWAAGDLKPAEQNAVARFVDYLLSPEIQVEIGVNSGFLPMTRSARTTLDGRPPKGELAALRVAQRQLKGGLPEMTRIRPAQIEAVRRIVEAEFDAVLADVKPAKEALETAARRGNAAMKLAK